MGARIPEVTMSDKQTPFLSRRRAMAAGGTVGALAAAAAALPLVKPAPQAEGSATAQPAPEKGGGYQLTAHVQHYYDTTRI
jgi:hypothetical protein